MPLPTPEQKAREKIDQQLARAGWLVQDYAQMHLSAGPSVAVREFPLQTGFADYLLYLDGRAAGVIEAKPEGHSLIGVELQSLKYMNGLPENVPAHGRPLPFGYESTGTETRFSNSRGTRLPQPRGLHLPPSRGASPPACFGGPAPCPWSGDAAVLRSGHSGANVTGKVSRFPTGPLSLSLPQQDVQIPKWEARSRQ